MITQLIAVYPARASLTFLALIVGFTIFFLSQTVQKDARNANHSRSPAVPEALITTEVPTKPISVNYHFTRKCNKECGFCFHTEKSSYVASEEDMRRGLALLKAAGMLKINFAGGEPFLYASKLGMLVRFCKQELKLQSVSIITNGTKVTKKWMVEFGEHIDVMGVSCDSFDEETNIKIGRGTGENVTQLFRIKEWCDELGIKFKLNTVVCKYNWDEDMKDVVQKLDPFRWKCFQCLYVEGENDDSEVDTALDKRRGNARTLLVNDEQWKTFCLKHDGLRCFVPESNEAMASSYLILDEYLCFLDKGIGGIERQSKSILDVGVKEAMSQVKWDQEAFKRRGGMYEWSKDIEEKVEGSGCGSAQKRYEW
ncbi:radical SAM enzyme [Polychaeton citri CBS 116435]|uniref:Radical SAM enzyme n=1 Tax=Polychaeton citri CBS 116435 TaxID=1314669 RepID=A0A9P4QE40_9PEZI|nr:radical SAM enzyme [Polychaeton citri CBS 116435]